MHKSISLQKQKVMRHPGFEPGSTAWKAAMLTTIPLTLIILFTNLDNLFQYVCLSSRKGYCRDQDSNLGYCGHNAGS